MRTIGRRALWIAALALLGLLLAAWLISDVPLTLKVGVAALLALATWSPGRALLVWVGLAPLTTSIAGLAGTPLLGAQLLEFMTLAVIAGTVARHTTKVRTRLALPALVMGAVAVASGLAELPARLLAATQEHVGVLALARLLFDHHVDRIPPLDPWYFALLVAEGAALAWAAESTVRRQPVVARRVVWCALLGHAGVAVLNISRVFGASLRGGDFPASLPGFFLTVREHTQYDVNAAASIFIMVVLAALGLFSRRAAIPAALATVAVSIAVWITGSRTAVAALLMTMAMVMTLRARRSARAPILAGAALLVLAGVAAFVALGADSGRLDVSTSVSTRLILFNSAARMAREAPVLGVGAGTFLEKSPHYGATALQPVLGRSRDNAHNYFLQTAAEQGALGLIALLAILAAALGPTLRGAHRGDALATWLAAGIAASILTWLTGHPLLVTEAALVFWLFIGVLAGQSEAPAPRPILRRLAIAAAVALLMSIPFRATLEERAANLEYLGTGVSRWQPAIDGERYREADAEFSLFLPSGTTMTLPIRSAIASDVTIELRSGQRLIDTAVAMPGLWRPFRIQVPDDASRFVKIDFRVIPPPLEPGPCRGCVWVGKAVPLVTTTGPPRLP